MNGRREWSRAASRGMLIAATCIFALAAWRVWSAPGGLWRLRPLPALPAVAGSGGALVVAYQAGDCGSYAAFIQQWQDLHREGEFEVVGVPLDAGNRAEWARRALEDIAPAYHVRPDLARPLTSVLAGLRRLRTPAAVLLDAQGRPQLVLDAAADPRQVRRAHELVASYRTYMQERR